MYKLEHGSDDLQKGKEKVMSLTEIEESRMSMQDDYILNRMARDKFRVSADKFELLHFYWILPLKRGRLNCSEA